MDNFFDLIPVLACCFATGLVSPVSSALAEEEANILGDKTFVVWACPENLDQRGGSALTITKSDPAVDYFDAVVLGEAEAKVWMPGSTNYLRTETEQSGWTRETEGSKEFVQIAIVHKDKGVKAYRNGSLFADYTIRGEQSQYGLDTTIMFGPRHPGNPDRFRGRIRDARVYATALSQAQIAAMKPSKAVKGVQLWAWWDFATGGTYDKAGRFNEVKLFGDAKIVGDSLVLAGDNAMMLASIDQTDPSETVNVPTQWHRDQAVPGQVIRLTRMFREKLLDDPYRPGYHFAAPDDMALPGDSNGCFYANGRYHLMYLYNRTGIGMCWGHLSSTDLVHWRHHPDSIGPGDGDQGCFSGGGFLDDDGTAYLTYWMLTGAKGIGIAKSSDAHYDNWKKFESNPVIKSTEFGITEIVDEDGNELIYGTADPTNIWKKDGKYYMCTGNLVVLNKYGRKPDSPEKFKGDHVDLFESEDLKEWKYKGRFYERNPEWTDASEDNMCPSFLPLPSSPDGGKPSGKHLMLFISHNKGCQYYVGVYDTKNDKFIPENHGRMTWVDNAYFAPEALIDGKGRQIMWAWLLDNLKNEKAMGWSGVYGLPRSLWVGKDGTLRMRPVKELEILRCNEKKWRDVTLTDGKTKNLEGVFGDSCELQFTVTPGASAKKFGVKVLSSADGSEQTLLYYDAETNELVFDSTRSGIDGRKVVERAPLKLKSDKALNLRVFVDKSIVEIYANDRQAICRRVYPGRKDSLGVTLFVEDGKAKFKKIMAWEMMPSNPY
jgi:beta-fructofuranosidase